MVADRTGFLASNLGGQHAKIASSRVLMVGAGGIGCELLKNLVLSGFGEIHVVDLDTIDLSNLNRQFLFQRQHISKSKAHVARETALQFNPDAKVFSYHANIKDKQFDVEWFSGFTLVVNALDNIDARRYVNRMCLAANVPLVESGTAGYAGQVSVISKGKTACYDCQPVPTPKTFAVCTIRSTPSLPIHCIVWAKDYLFSQIFGPEADEEDNGNTDFGSDNGKCTSEEIENLKREAAALKELRGSIGSEAFPTLLFEKVFVSDVKRLLEMKDLWKTRTPPTPLDGSIKGDSKRRRLNGDGASAPGAPAAQEGASRAARDQKVGSLEDNMDMFTSSVEKLCSRLLADRQTDPSASLSFDKDDDDVMDFVAATANLRAAVYGIPMLSRFKSKEMAGNIIPAVATTNAIVAGFIVLEAFKILAGDLDTCSVVYTKNKRVIGDPDAFGKEGLRPPNPECAVCQSGFCVLAIDTAETTLGGLVEDVLRDAESGLGLPGELTIENGSRQVYLPWTALLYDPDVEDDVLERTLEDLGITHGTVLDVRVDQDDDEGISSFFLFVLSRCVGLSAFGYGSLNLPCSKQRQILTRPELRPRKTLVAAAAEETALPPPAAETVRKVPADNEVAGPVLIDD
ncbi:ThiF family protein [Hyaloraphidium curvatum]|nr:ThiF family protein [Hyaloraphidium curvatum]